MTGIDPSAVSTTLQGRVPFSVYGRAMTYFRPDLRWIGVLCVLIGGSVVSNLLAAWPTALLVDVVLTPTPRATGLHHFFLSFLPASRPAQILALTLAGLAIKLSFETIWMARMMINARLRLMGTRRVRADLYWQLQQLGVPYHRTHSQGERIYHIASDALGLWGILDTFIGSAVAAITLIGMTVILLSRNVTLTLFVLSTTPFLILVNLYFGRTIKGRSLEARRMEADLTTVTQRALGAIAIILSFVQQRREFERFETTQARLVHAGWRLAWQENLYPLVVQSLFGIGTAIILGYGGYLAYRDTFVEPNPQGISAGDLIVFLAYFNQLWDPLQWVVGFFAKVQPFVAASVRAFAVLDTPREIPEEPDAAPLPVRARTLALEHVWFAYGDQPAVLRDVSARVEPGEMVAFIGPSGSGKSTLLNLLVRFQDPLAGSVRLDGHDLRTVRVDDARHHFALVPQDSMLFPVSIAENIAYGRPDATHAEIEEAARAAGIANAIATFPEGYETMVTEGAQNLSGGQRQRVAIARAILSGAPILVLDEPTSALDPEHEQHVLETLSSLRGQRTILLVTHRVESVSRCDRVFQMRSGALTEAGALI